MPLTLFELIQEYQNPNSNNQVSNLERQIKNLLRSYGKNLNLTLDDAGKLVDIVLRSSELEEFKKWVIKNYVLKYLQKAKEISKQQTNDESNINLILDHAIKINILEKDKFNKEMEVDFYARTAATYYKKIYAEDKKFGFLPDVKKVLAFSQKAIKLSQPNDGLYKRYLYHKQNLLEKLKWVQMSEECDLNEKIEAQEIILELYERSEEPSNKHDIVEAYDRMASLIKKKIQELKAKCGEEWFLNEDIITNSRLVYNCYKAASDIDDKYIEQHLKTAGLFGQTLEHSDPQKAFLIYKNVIELLKKYKIKNTELLANSYSRFGACALKVLPKDAFSFPFSEDHSWLIDLRNAKDFLKKAVDINQDKHDKHMLINVLIRLGMAYEKHPDQTKCRDYFAEAMELAISNNEIRKRAAVEKEYASFLTYYNKDKELALQYYFQAYHHIFLYAEENKSLTKDHYNQYSFFKDKFKKSYDDISQIKELARSYSELYGEKDLQKLKKRRKLDSLSDNKSEEKMINESISLTTNYNFK